MNTILKASIKHIIIFSLLVIGMLLILLIASLFTTLHPDAYKDGVMSIVYVYILIIPIHILIVIIKKTTRFNAFKIPKYLHQWHQDLTIFMHIAIGFSVITLANSMMMITGLDVPKTNTFAYIHLLVRTLIVTIAVMIWMYKDVIQSFKSLVNYFKETHVKRKELRKSYKLNLITKITQNPFSHSLTLFGWITILGCVIMVMISPMVNPQGGFRLYASLLILYLVLMIYAILYHKQKRWKSL